ncbi:hypothetical protein JOF56_002648 [Kibdelosporangium banguiense]|uniref:Uncharacterized protein n=1 Tax=Kibdelosporangium banguiense TaxID=1365924 RepID=A0ABS4TCU6_9PSEU|nr:hypothetical protein [Kibdelosporangium banguiense]MBP2322263.1 hypothetical protein [Kibdelosporangium banguiense]
MTGSGLARGAGTMLRRLVVRVALLIGFTAGAWLVSALFAGTASADVRLPLDVPGLNLNIGGSSQQPPAATNSKPTKDKNTKNTKSARSGDNNGGLGGLIGGLVGGVTSTVTNTVTTVTTTVTKTVTTVTTTVTTTLGTVTKTVSTVTKTVTKVVDDVAKLPEQILTPPPSTNDNKNDKSVLQPVTDLLNLGQNNGAQTDTQRTETPPSVQAPAVTPVTAPPAVQAPTATDRPRVTTEPRQAETTAVPARTTGWTSEKAAPTDNWPGPLPSPTAPGAPAAPCPTFSSGSNGGSDARGMLAVLPLQTQLAPPQAGRLHDQQFAAELGRTAGLPATPPD